MVRTSGDRTIARLAERQHAVVTTAQLAAAGLSRHAIEHRVDHAWLTRLHRGVYQVGPVPTPFTAQFAALLAIGPRAVLSHRTAAEIWGFLPRADEVMDVTATGTPRRRAGVRLHRVKALDPAETSRRHDLPLTTPNRTLLDLAATIGRAELELAVNEALVARLVSLNGLHSHLARSSQRRGVAALRAVLLDDPGITRSEAERALKRLIRRARLPRPLTNVHVAGYEVDAYWPDHGVVVEVDSVRYHSTPRAFQRDRRKEADLHAVGLRLIRVTRWDVVREPEAVVARLATATASPRRRT